MFESHIETVRIFLEWLLMIFAVVVVAGWVWRVKMHMAYVLPRAGKIAAIISYSSIAAIFAIGIFLDWPEYVSMIMVRVVLLVIMSDQIMQHIYIWNLRRYARSR